MRAKALARLPWLVKPSERGDDVSLLVMNNYLGIGIDAQVAFTFDSYRHARPDLFVSRLVNKLWYFYFGAADFARTQLARVASRVNTAVQSLAARAEDSPLNALTSVLGAPAAAAKSVTQALRRRAAAAAEAFSWGLLGLRTSHFGRVGRGAATEGAEAFNLARRPGAQAEGGAPLGGGLRRAWTLAGRCRAHGGCVGLARKLEVVLDAGRPTERVVPLPPNAQGLVLLNIDSFMGGGRMWGLKQRGLDQPWAVHSPDDDDDNDDGEGSGKIEGEGGGGATAVSAAGGAWGAADGMLEVVCVESSLHLGRILLGMARPGKLGQAATVDLRSNVTLPLQVGLDAPPHTPGGGVPMLKKRVSGPGWD
jgi:hypothetical protein